MEHFIGLDIGTSAVKGLLLSKDGITVAKASGEYAYYKQGSGKLMEPAVFLDTCFGVIRSLASHVPTDGTLNGICPCCASGNLIFLDEEKKPLTPIIGWQSEIDPNELKGFYTAEEADAVYQTVGWPTAVTFPGGYFPWIAKHRPDIIERSSMICMSAEYLNFALTGSFGLSHSMGTPFYLMDQAKGIYNRAMLDRFGIKEEQLPPIRNKGSVVGNVTEEAAAKLQITAGIPVVLGSFDHPSCATGAGVYTPGEVLLSCGTSWVEFFPVETREEAIATGLLVDRYMLSGAPYCVMSSIPSLSVKIDALRERYLKGISHKELDELAVQAEAGCHGLTFDFTEADFDKADSYSQSDVARAIYESAARLLKTNLDDAAKKGLKSDKITMVGGITNTAVCMQIIADTLGCEITVVNGVSAGAAGAAMLAGIGAGVYADEADAFAKMNFAPRVYTAK